jgi:lipid-A-disaccharide synthase
MKKIFVLTGETSGDKLASKVVVKLKNNNPNIEFLSVGGEYLKSLGIKSIYELNEITYLGFTKVILNIFKIKKKINETVEEILKFNPDILFSVDSPDFTLRVCKKIKQLRPNIKTIHYVAPQVWVWREGRVKKIKKFIDHILLLFNFEKKYFDKENVKSTFVGHPLLDKENRKKVSLNSLLNINKKIISIFPGSRLPEIRTLMPILIRFILLVKRKKKDYFYVFHTTKELKDVVNSYLLREKLSNCEIISEENIKLEVLSKSSFAIAKSGTISIEICNAKIPSLIIYKVSSLNYFIAKLFVKVNFANIFNIIAKAEIIPELLQSKCNENEIFNIFDKYISNPDLGNSQITSCTKILESMKLEKSSSEKVANILLNEL